MKKKFGIWLNIVTICLCICAIAIGVYAANTASLTVSGQVGFTAHGVELTIDGTLSGYVSLANKDTATATENKNLTQVKLNNNSGAMNLGEVYFTDLLGDIPPIVLTLTVTNTSNFKVLGTVDISALTTSTVGASCATTEVSLDAKGGANASAEVVITFTLVSAEESITAVNLATLTASKPIMTFEKNISHAEGELYVENGRMYVNYGTFPAGDTTNFGDNAGKPIRWVAIKDLTANSTLDLANMTSVPASGNFYFMTEYVFDSQYFNESGGSKANNAGTMCNSNDYEISDVRACLLGDTFKTKYSLTALFNDTRVTARKLNPESIEDKSAGVTVSTTINNCTDKIWLLSENEISLVSTAVGTLCAYLPTVAVDNIYNAEYTANNNGNGWWLCSTRPNNPRIARCVSNTGGLSSNDITLMLAIRPVFQLNLSA